MGLIPFLSPISIVYQRTRIKNNRSCRAHDQWSNPRLLSPHHDATKRLVLTKNRNWPAPRSEKLPVPFLLLKKKTQRDYLKVMLFSVDWSELVSSQKTK